jgi:hypothetical protein
VASGKATTLAVVVEREELDYEAYVGIVRDSLTGAGWEGPVLAAMPADLAQFAAQLDVGCHVRRDLDDIHVSNRRRTRSSHARAGVGGWIMDGP